LFRRRLTLLTFCDRLPFVFFHPKSLFFSQTHFAGWMVEKTIF
jgi:hypothetical protein